MYLESLEGSKNTNSMSPPPPRDGIVQHHPSPSILDLSWKEGGRRNFPKQASKVGIQHQVEIIPKAGTSSDENNRKSDS
jgi:hypothetical protein